MSVDLTVPTELTERRVKYAATVAKLQLQTALELATEITNNESYAKDPLVMALFNAIVANYGAVTMRPKD